MKKNLLAIVVAATFLAPAAALAQARPGERKVNQAEKRQNRRQSVDDAVDTARLQKVLADFDAARAAGSAAKLRSVDARLQALMRQEAREGRRELRQDSREVRRSRRERNRNVRGAARRDDRRDLRDDRRDRRAEARSAARRSAIATELSRLHGRYDQGALARKRSLIVELIALARQEQRQNRRERREDRRERREDRR